jgi:hypothetical protein
MHYVTDRSELTRDPPYDRLHDLAARPHEAAAVEAAGHTHAHADAAAADREAG